MFTSCGRKYSDSMMSFVDLESNDPVSVSGMECGGVVPLSPLSLIGLWLSRSAVTAKKSNPLSSS